MSGVIENGQRLPVAFGPYSEMAGLVEREGGTEVAFIGAVRKLRGVTDGEIAGEMYRILDMRQSEVVPSMVVLTVTAVTNGA